MTKRINITVSDVVYESLKKISEDFGMPVSSLGSIAIMSWLEQKQVVNAMGDLKGLMSQVALLQGGKK